MKNKEEVEALQEGDILYDKIARGPDGRPLKWKVVGNFQQARHNEDYWIRRIELDEEAFRSELEADKDIDSEDEELMEKLHGYSILKPENMENVCKDENVAMAYQLLWEMEDGLTPELKKQFKTIVDMLLHKQTAGDRLKELDLI